MNSKRIFWMAAAMLGFLLGAGPAFGQFNVGTPNDWTTSQGNAQRTGWIRHDLYISTAAMKTGNFKLQWKIQVGGPASQTLHTGIGFVARFEPQVMLTGSDNNVYSYDADTGREYWSRHFTAAVGTATASCAAGLTDVGSRVTLLQVPNTPLTQRTGTGSYRAVLGQPGEGLPAKQLIFVRNFRRPAPARRGATAARGTTLSNRGGEEGRRAAAPPRNIMARYRQPSGFFVVASDGVLHELGTSSGIDTSKPLPLVAANAAVADLTDISGVIYGATRNGCGGAANGVFAVRADGSSQVVTWKSGGASPAGFAFAPNGTVYASVGAGTGSYSDSVVALDRGTLAVKDHFSAAGANFTTAPSLMQVGNRELVTAATADGRVYLLDAAALGKALYVSPAYSHAAPGGLAVWQAADGTTYVLEPFTGPAPAGLGASTMQGGVLALKLTGSGSAVSLAPAWVSPNLGTPMAPLVVADVVFAASRGSASAPARLVALSAANGQQLWSSGNQINGAAETGTGLTTTSGQVYLLTRSHTLYAFGFPLGRYVNSGF